MQAGPHPIQTSLFIVPKGAGAYAPLVFSQQPLTGTASLAVAIQAYHACLVSGLYSEPTVKAFIIDVCLLRRYAGMSRPVSAITTAELGGFLSYLRSDRG